jgi:hypothetical protein
MQVRSVRTNGVGIGVDADFQGPLADEVHVLTYLPLHHDDVPLQHHMQQQGLGTKFTFTSSLCNIHARLRCTALESLAH